MSERVPGGSDGRLYNPRRGDLGPKASSLRAIAGSPALTVLLVSGAVLLLVGVGTGTAYTGLPSPQELPPKAVAVVIHVPADLETIHKSDFDRAMEQDATQAHLTRVPGPGEWGYEKLKKTAISGLLDKRWIQGQAAEMGIRFTAREVAAQVAQIKKENFKSAAEYKKFLKTSHYTQAEVNELVRLQLLSTAIQSQVVRGVKGKKLRQQVLTRFVAEYMQRWRSRTVCAQAYVFHRCSNGPPFQRGYEQPPS